MILNKKVQRNIFVETTIGKLATAALYLQRICFDLCCVDWNWASMLIRGIMHWWDVLNILYRTIFTPEIVYL